MQVAYTPTARHPFSFDSNFIDSATVPTRVPVAEAEGFWNVEDSAYGVEHCRNCIMRWLPATIMVLANPVNPVGSNSPSPPSHKVLYKLQSIPNSSIQPHRSIKSPNQAYLSLAHLSFKLQKSNTTQHVPKCPPPPTSP